MLDGEVTLSPQEAAELDNGLADGVSFYTSYNESRLKLATASFDEDMRKALFEVLFLLHVNDPRLAEVHYPVVRQETVDGNIKEVEREETANLYLEDAPAGVKGLEALSPVFRENYEQHIGKEMGLPPYGAAKTGHRPIVLIQSIGSIGTVGHKSGASDLDLQVIFELLPSSFDPAQWDDDTIALALYLEQSWRADRIQEQLASQQQGGTDAGGESKPRELAQEQMGKAYRLLTRYFQELESKQRVNLNAHPWGKRRAEIAFELMRLIKRNRQIRGSAETARLEALLRQRTERIQHYINDKYPAAEIYLFTYSADMFRAGQYQSSLEFKESSGSAYELILNYDTLMPGIQFTPTIPAHFLFSGKMNNDPAEYQRWVAAAEFGKLASFESVLPLLVDLGPAPDLELDYVTRHGGALYWEAFKASSGNLPKATLNLLRYEMLLDPRMKSTIIQLIKEPGSLNFLVTKATGDESLDEKALHTEDGGLPNWFLLYMEFDHPQLLKDPWWLRYKALKIGFGEINGVPGLSAGERSGLSLLIDIAFALHVRISDVITKPGARRDFDSHRERVLVQYLQNAFPEGTQKRVFLEHIFAGEVSAVKEFEMDLRSQFRLSLARALDKIDSKDWEELNRKNKEVKLWRHYYEDNFEPKDNVVSATIMQHLMIPRGRLQIGNFKGEGWTFRSLQRESGVGRRFDRYGILSHLPEEVTLVDRTGFLHGIAECILNGYYGIENKGMLKETRTALEFDRQHMDMGDSLDSRLAYLRPDQVEKIMERILEFFPPEPYHYMDFFHKDRRLGRILIFLNLWKFGRLSILSRDNLNTWYCDEIDHPDLESECGDLQHDPDRLLSAPSLHESLDRYLSEHTLFVDEVELAAWVNPNSVTTHHSSAQTDLKERELSEALLEAINESQPKLYKSG